MVEPAKYREILVLLHPNHKWSGSGETYSSIVWQDPPIPQATLDSERPLAERIRETRRAVERIRKGAREQLLEGFDSATTGVVQTYSADPEALASLHHQATAAHVAVSDTFYYITINTDVVALTAAQMQELHVDYVRRSNALYLHMLSQIAALDAMTTDEISAVRYVRL